MDMNVYIHFKRKYTTTKCTCCAWYVTAQRRNEQASTADGLLTFDLGW